MIRIQRPSVLRGVSRRALFLGAAVAGALLLGSPESAHADRIYLSDGKIIEDADVQSETAEKIVYTQGSSKKTEEVASDLVLRVEYTEVPGEFTTAQVDTENESFESAAAGYSDYLSNVASRGDKAHPWGPPAAHFRLVMIGKLANDLEMMSNSLTALNEANPDSRYVPMAMAALADHRLLNKDKSGAIAALDQLESGAGEGRFPQRWQLEARVRRVVAEGTLKGQNLEKELANIAKEASIFPTVTAFANTRRAESMVQRGELDGAITALRAVVAASAATDGIMALAYTTLGEALYAKAEAMARGGNTEGAKPIFEDARLAFMRVVVSYPFEYGYVAKSAIGAGRCFIQIKDEGWKDNAISLFRFVRRKFSGTDFSTEALRLERPL